MPVIAAVIEGRRPSERQDRCGDDHCSGADDSAHHAERPLKWERRAGRIVLSLGGREGQSGKPDAERGRNRNSSDTHEGSPGSDPARQAQRSDPTREAEEAYSVQKEQASAAPRDPDDIAVLADLDPELHGLAVGVPVGVLALDIRTGDVIAAGVDTYQSVGSSPNYSQRT